MTGAVFSLCELSTDLKKQILIFKILVKRRYFVVIHYINRIVNKNCKNYFFVFLRFMISEIIFIFFVLKIIDLVEITSDTPFADVLQNR